MTLEYLELMEDLKKQEIEVQGTSSPRRKLQKLQRSFKSNTRIYDDGSIEVDPQAQGEPSQKDVKKVGKSKRYVTNGKNPLTCVELKCPENVPDKAAFFHKELAKLTKDTAWLTFDSEGFIGIRKEFYILISKIEKCFAFNESSVCQLKS